MFPQSLRLHVIFLKSRNASPRRSDHFIKLAWLSMKSTFDNLYKWRNSKFSQQKPHTRRSRYEKHQQKIGVEVLRNEFYALSFYENKNNINWMDRDIWRLVLSIHLVSIVLPLLSFLRHNQIEIGISAEPDYCYYM